MPRIRPAPIAAASRLSSAVLGCAACVLAIVCWAGAASAGDRPAGRSAVRAGIQSPAQSDRMAGVLDAFARADGDERVRQALDIFFNDPEAKRIGGISCLIRSEDSGDDRRGPPCVPFLGFG